MQMKGTSKNQNKDQWNIRQKKQRKRNKTKSWFFEKISKIDKTLVKLIREKKDIGQIINIRNERGDVIDYGDIKKDNMGI